MDHVVYLSADKLLTEQFADNVAMARPSDIRAVLASYQGRDIPAEFIERSKEHQR
ncbi:hypothetical protein [Oryza sativa Japonica Group]|uniref:p0460E08.37 protein n=1 Tax=Oryza sativa subsp. japonica TaxID=39947 RepID=Q94DR4_ORYSJ|nr:P0460E08.37 [Oryza sativa Japonica Group]BAB92369.1 hypothetical protein [Oryza sativa Japonica Group]